MIKEARDYAKGDDLGEVQEIGKEFVVTERGRLKKVLFTKTLGKRI
jgi:hypothetical protein